MVETIRPFLELQLVGVPCVPAGVLLLVSRFPFSRCNYYFAVS